MRRRNQKAKPKEPVRLRMKALANGNQSLYLDTYINGRRRYEFLRLYLVPEESEADKAVNEATMRAAISIKAKRILALVNEKADIKPISCHFSLKEWIEKVIDLKRGSHSISSIRLLERLLKHIQIYRPLANLSDVDRAFCKGFADYLRSAQALNSTKPLMPATQFELMNALSIILNEGVRIGLIPNNPLRLLNVSERPRKTESYREYLTPDEVRALIDQAAANIAAGDDVAAFIFCCFCGLRYSDICRLKWRNISETDCGWMITTVMKKTQRMVAVPVSETAISLLPSSGAPDESVFSFPHYSVTSRKLKQIAKAAGIAKKVTFHVSRHTFATMMLTAGADLYTISKLIGHSDVRTTQIYSKVVDKKKQEAITMLDKFFSQNF